MKSQLTTATVLTSTLLFALTTVAHSAEQDAQQGTQQWVVYSGTSGPGVGQHIVLISGDEEYRSEEALPQLGKILATRHGFKCTVLFAINPDNGTIDPDVRDNIPGLEALESADLMIIATRFRDLPDDQMQHIVSYLDSGRPVIGMRTATHAFNIAGDHTFKRYSFNSKEWDGGFGRQILGETWISHHGHHGQQSTRGIIAEDMRDHAIMRGVKDIWGPTDVYGVRLPLPEGCRPLVFGQILKGMRPDDAPLEGDKNDPMMPVAWIKSYSTEDGKQGRVFTTTMGSSTDLENAGVRRMLVNAAYWSMGLEDKIDGSSNVDIVGEYKPLPFKFGGFQRGMKPTDHAL